MKIKDTDLQDNARYPQSLLLGTTLRTSHTPPLSRSDLVLWHKAAVSIFGVMSAAGDS
jgi:hypothetical protein